MSPMVTSALDEDSHLTTVQRTISLGLTLILRYINAGVTPDDLASIKAEAQQWIKTYMRQTQFTFSSWRRHHVQPPAPVLREHPYFFDLTRPSWERLDLGRPRASSGSGSDSSESDVERDVAMAMLFRGLGIHDLDAEVVMDHPVRPERSMKMLLRDTEIHHMVDVLDREWTAAMGCERDPDSHAHERTSFRPADLKSSPIIFFIPDIMGLFADLNIVHAGRLCTPHKPQVITEDVVMVE
ncbi:hypothetical protein E4U21_003478 [Claviceps maximensis]|nr:hypothetical protein E4U21_003478 [Claviceps maximensis]